MNPASHPLPEPICAYALVNGLNMYYELHGSGKPLVLIHGGGSTIASNFGRVIPYFAQKRRVVAVELQAHGRTPDRDADLSFEQDADDVAALLQMLGISEADIFGFSNGATTTLQIAIRHPRLVHKLVLGSALTKRRGVNEGFWKFMDQASLEHMPAPLKQAYLDVNPDPKGLQTMHDRDARRMQNFRDIPSEQIRAIQAPVLVVNGDQDVILPEHALELYRELPHARLAILPGTHGAYIGEVTTLGPHFSESSLAVPLIESFLEEKIQSS